MFIQDRASEIFLSIDPWDTYYDLNLIPALFSIFDETFNNKCVIVAPPLLIFNFGGLQRLFLPYKREWQIKLHDVFAVKAEPR